MEGKSHDESHVMSCEDGTTGSYWLSELLTFTPFHILQRSGNNQRAADVMLLECNDMYLLASIRFTPLFNIMIYIISFLVIYLAKVQKKLTSVLQII